MTLLLPIPPDRYDVEDERERNRLIEAADRENVKRNRSTAFPDDVYIGAEIRDKGGAVFNVKHPEFGAIGDGTTDDTAALNAAITAATSDKGVVMFPPGVYVTTSALSVPDGVSLVGAGRLASTIENQGSGNAVAVLGTVSTAKDGVHIADLWVKGNASSSHGIHLEYTSERGDGVVTIDRCRVSGHGGNGIDWSNGGSANANGDGLRISNSTITGNTGRGVYVFGLSNLASIIACGITDNGNSGVEFNQVASNCTVFASQINDNGLFGVLAYRAEQPAVLWCAFNRNTDVAVAINGDATKYSEAATVEGCLFGDNAPSSYDVSVRYTKTATIRSNYFYGTNAAKPAYIRLSTEALGVLIASNRWNTTTGTPAKVSVIDSSIVYDFIDSGDETRTATVRQHSLGECVVPESVASSSGALDLSSVTTTTALVDLTENLTSITFPSSPLDGQKLVLRFRQAAGSSFTVAGWPASVLLAGGAFTMTATNSKQDVLSFAYTSTTSQWLEVSRSQNL